MPFSRKDGGASSEGGGSAPGKRPPVIAIEGIDGAGKSTLISRLREQLPLSLYQRTKKGRILDRIVSGSFLQRHIMLQVPIYLLLSYRNYLSFLLRRDGRRPVVMDRCFLSSICYFHPGALDSEKLFRRLMRLEAPLYPNAIFILDVDPETGRERDSRKKTLSWMEQTRSAYLRAGRSLHLARFHIQVIDDTLSVEEKCRIIARRIEELSGPA